MSRSAPPPGSFIDDYLAAVDESSLTPPAHRTPNALQPTDVYELLTLEELESLPAPTWLVDGLLPTTGLVVLYGPPDAGKSFVALNIALSVGAGVSCFGLPVKRGPVLYVIAEGVYGMGIRARGWRKARGLSARVQFHALGKAVQLLEKSQMQRLARTIAAMPVKPALIVFDTFARCFLGGEENSSSDVGLAVHALDLLKQNAECCILVVHHTNKAGEQERGSVALRGGADTMLALKETDGGLSLSCDKQKDGRKPDPIPVRLESVGDTLVAGLPKRERVGLSKTDLAFLNVLATAFSVAPASKSEWRDASSKVGKDAKSSFYYARGRLLKHHLVAEEKVGNSVRYAVTPDGLMALAGKWDPISSPEQSRLFEPESLDNESRVQTAVQTPVPGGVNLPDSLDRLDGGVETASGQHPKTGRVQKKVQSPDAVQTLDADQNDLLAEIDERAGMQDE